MSSAINLALAGDVMLGRLMNEAIPRRGYAYPWGNVIGVLNKADLFMINLECAITAHTGAWHDGAAKEFYFRADPPVIETLRLGGVDFASLANNHACDFCDEGLLETVRLLDSAGGSGGVTVVATHALRVAGAADRLKNIPVERMIVTDSVPVPTDTPLLITVCGLDSLLSEAIRRLHAGESLGELICHE